MPNVWPPSRDRDLPDVVKAQMSPRAQGVFRSIVALARRQHRDEETAFRLAWCAVQRDFQRQPRERPE